METKLDRIKNPINNRELVYVEETKPWLSYNIVKAFKVKNNIFNEKNWQELTTRQIQQLRNFKEARH